MLTGNAAARGGGAYGGTLDHCLLTNNWASEGGGACSSQLLWCGLESNRAASSGGGAYGGTLLDCMLVGNFSPLGGGVCAATLQRCNLTANSSDTFGGGTIWSTLSQSLLLSNSAAWSGGADESSLTSCLLLGNKARYRGGGADHCTLNNCVVIGNSATNGGGVGYGSLLNCIVFDNFANRAPNYEPEFVTLNYSCTSPLPSKGEGNICENPRLATVSHLSAESPCRGTGSAIYAAGLDLEGNTWANPPSMGCSEFAVPPGLGASTASFTVSRATVVAGSPVDLVAWSTGPALAAVWDFGDGTTLTNQALARHTWLVPGSYTVTLRILTQAPLCGASAARTIEVLPRPVHHVSAHSATPAVPFASWATAAHTIQEAVEAATVPGALVLVSNGIYASGGRALADGVSNRIAVDRPLVVSSLNGPAVTFIEGWRVAGVTYGPTAVRCAYLADGAVLTGFTLTNGVALGDGGGVWCESLLASVSNCVLVGNSASHSGGGVFRGTLFNCLLRANAASWGGGASQSRLYTSLVTSNSSADGGGVEKGTLYNCTVAGNSAGRWGGVYCSTLFNSIVAYNFSAGAEETSAGDWYDDWCNNSWFDHCCTPPLSYRRALGNIVADPLFLDPVRGDYRLQTISPCLNVGLEVSCFGSTDLDDRPRVVGGAVDLGAFEHQGRVCYVSVENATPVFPYDSWTKAATNIQDAVDAAPPGGTVMVTNGLYEAGGAAVEGALTNRVAVTKPLLLQSVNGPEATIIQGYRVPETIVGDGAIRCVYLTNGVVLSGFMLTNGATRASGDPDREQSGGGAWCESTNVLLTNCMISMNTARAGGGVRQGRIRNSLISHNLATEIGGGTWQSLVDHSDFRLNSAASGAGMAEGLAQHSTFRWNEASLCGGGSAWGILCQCVLRENTAADGGGSYLGQLNNCTLVLNSATHQGGGATLGALTNCIVRYNRAGAPDSLTRSNYSDALLDYCYADPLPDTGRNNIAGDRWSLPYPEESLLLPPDSPCINAGLNAVVVDATDLAGRPRIVGGTVDIGAYEFQSPASRVSYAWLRAHHLPADGSADLVDGDGDGLNTWQEWLCGTEPADPGSVLRLLPTTNGPAGLTITWRGVPDKSYTLERSTSLTHPPAFETLGEAIPGRSPLTTFLDTNPPAAGAVIYRVKTLP